MTALRNPGVPPKFSREQSVEKQQCQYWVTVYSHGYGGRQCKHLGYPIGDGRYLCGNHGGVAPFKRRGNGLPENTDYTDDGCDIHDACLTCPLPRCRYELPPGQAKALVGAGEVVSRLKAGRTQVEVAKELGISVRTVYRHIRRAQEQQHEQIPARV